LSIAPRDAWSRDALGKISLYSAVSGPEIPTASRRAIVSPAGGSRSLRSIRIDRLILKHCGDDKRRRIRRRVSSSLWLSVSPGRIVCWPSRTSRCCATANSAAHGRSTFSACLHTSARQDADRSRSFESAGRHLRTIVSGQPAVLETGLEEGRDVLPVFVHR